MPAPISLLQVRKLFKQLARRATLDPPHDLTRRHRRWTTRQYVYMVLAHHTLDYPDLEGFTGLPNQLSYPLRYLASENLVAVLRNPYKVILNLKYRMTAVSVLHAAPPFVQPIPAAKADRLKPVV